MRGAYAVAGRSWSLGKRVDDHEVRREDEQSYGISAIPQPVRGSEDCGHELT